MLKQITFRLYSHDAKKMADFYAKAFNVTRVRTGNSFDQEYYECVLTPDFKIKFYYSEVKHEPIELEFYVNNIDKIRQSILAYDIKIEYDDKGKKQFIAEDLDGNKMNIIQHNRLVGVAMPILG